MTKLAPQTAKDAAPKSPAARARIAPPARDRDAGHPEPLATTTRDRILRHSLAAAEAEREAEAPAPVEVPAPVAEAPAPVEVPAPVAEAPAPATETVHARTPAAPTPAPAEAEAEREEALDLGLDADGALLGHAALAARRRRRGARDAHRPPPRRRGEHSSGPSGDRSTGHSTPHPAAHEPVRDATAPPARAVEPHARGPPHRELTSPTSSPRPPPLIQTKLAVGRAGDAFEREADAVSERVMRAAAPMPPAAGTAACAPQRAPAQAWGPARPGLPRTVVTALDEGGGRPLDPGLRARLEPHVGIDLGHVRVREAAVAARDLGARAFTSGATIFLSAGASATDVGLMAHEATHVAQQAASPAARDTIQRDLEVTDLIPDWILDGVRSAVRVLPGYELLSTIVGEDLLTGQPAAVSRDELVETVLTHGPFGDAVAPVLGAMDILGQIFDFLREGLVANNLTLDRVGRDIEDAWDEFSITNGVSGNLAIVERKVRALVRDVGSFVGSVVDRVIELVREAVIDVAEPLLESPQISPIWNLTKKVIHYDPLRGETVEAETVDIIADFLRLIGEEQRLAQMEERGTLQETADWLDTQLAIFAGLVDELGTLFSDAWAAIQPENLPNLLDNLESLAQRAFDFVGRVAEFGTNLIAQILQLIKDSLLAWLSEHAHGVPGYRLLTVILGQDPFTDQPVERNAYNLIRGFITLMPGGEATFDQLAESGVVEQAAERIETEMGRLGISLELITGIFTGIWDELTLDDLLDPIGAFGRILDLFGEPLSRLIEFIGVVIEVMITLILRLMNFPSELLGRIIAGVTEAVDRIAADPVGFLLRLLEAVKLGFTSFFDHILGHLLTGLSAWLFRGLGQLGIRIPQDFTLASTLDLVFQVLGLTVEHLWEKLAQHIGAERVAMIRGAIDTLTGAWEFIKEVQRDGLAAIWRFISSQLGNLWETLLQTATDWIMNRVVSAVTTKLLSMLDPTGIMAVVNSAIALFSAIQSAIEYFREILEIVATYVDTLGAIAAGSIEPGARMLEQGLANAIPIAIGFLANQVGLGNIPEKIVEIIGSLRVLVDEAIDWLISGALRLGRALLNRLRGGAAEDPPPATDPASIRTAAETAIIADIEKMEEGGLTEAEIRAKIPTWREQHAYRTLSLRATDAAWVIEGQINPNTSVTHPRRGSRARPFQLVWYKRPSADYPELYFGGRIGRPRSQSVMKGLHSKGQNDETGEPVKKYTPHGTGTLPGGATIGIQPQYQTRVGTIVGPLQAEGTAGGRTLNRKLKPYGFVSTDEGLQGDHVHEMQFGGPNDIANMWPLYQAENGSGGSKLAQASVKYDSETEVKISELKGNATNYYFEITRFEY